MIAVCIFIWYDFCLEYVSGFYGLLKMRDWGIKREAEDELPIGPDALQRGIICSLSFFRLTARELII